MLLSVLGLLIGPGYASQDDKYRFEVGSSPYNVTYKDWAAKWWQWYVSVPKTHSPNNLDYPNHIQNKTCSVFQVSIFTRILPFYPVCGRKSG